MAEVRSAFVPTCDEFYLAHALDDYRQLAKQAYVFALSGDGTFPAAARGFALRPATADDAALIESEAGGFFAEPGDLIAQGKVFVTQRHGEPVGFGILERSALYDAVASIGMFTIGPVRQQGVGTATIGLLIAACRARGLRPIAGCWYYNHASQRTLERAGMAAQSRLLKIVY